MGAFCCGSSKKKTGGAITPDDYFDYQSSKFDTLFENVSKDYVTDQFPLKISKK